MDHSASQAVEGSQEVSAQTHVAPKTLDGKQLFERLPVVLLVLGWLAYGTSYASQMSFLWGLGFTPEQAGLGPASALIRATPGAAFLILGFAFAFLVAYLVLRYIAREWGVRAARIPISWRIGALVGICFLIPLVPLMFENNPMFDDWSKVTDWTFGMFWAAGLLGLAIQASFSRRRVLAAALMLTAYGALMVQITVNGSNAAEAVRNCAPTFRSVLVGFGPMPVQVTWPKPEDAPRSVRPVGAVEAAKPVAVQMFLITDNGSQYLLYSCESETSYTVEHSSVAIETYNGPPKRP